jgi:UDP-N-acetylmuramate--alanine ligase
MLDFNTIQNVYFLGIGGIGMSALARFFNHSGKKVAGYDRTCTDLTNQLVSEGIAVHYTDDPALIPSGWDPGNTLVVFTPAVPADHQELNVLKKLRVSIQKGAEVLG